MKCLYCAREHKNMADVVRLRTVAKRKLTCLVRCADEDACQRRQQARRREVSESVQALGVHHV